MSGAAVEVTGLPEGVSLTTEGLSWSDAFTWARTGARISRAQWAGTAMVMVETVSAGAFMKNPYLYVEADGIRVPWLPSMLDLFASDWMVV